jgi:hypothetical protein
MSDHPSLIILNIAMMIVSLAGTAVNAMMLITAARRRVILAESPLVQEITLRRAVRQESAFLLCQVLLLCVSIWGLVLFSDSIPTVPVTAVRFYVGTLLARSTVSLILCAASLWDWKDRRWLKGLMDRESELNKGCP